MIHDGFELMAWKDFMREEKYVNVVLDTHQYLMMAEADGCAQKLDAYLSYIKEHYEKDIEEMQNYFPVICGEWCLFNSLACGCDTKGGQSVLNGIEGNDTEQLEAEEKRKSTARLPRRNLQHGKKAVAIFIGAISC